MILIIDNYDSFVYNIVQYVAEYDSDVHVYRNDAVSIEDVKTLSPDKIILSPGPKEPHHAGISEHIVKAFYQQIPILGICLGHQCIASAFDIPIQTASTIRHGKQSTIKIINAHPIFTSLPDTFTVTRYHSLSIPKKIEKLDNFNVLARSLDDDEIMAINHIHHNLIGLQFHPESILTDHGKTIIHNFLKLKV